MSPDATTDAAGRRGHFDTTRWSLILSYGDAEGDEGKAREALAQLCRIYWRPIFAFLCREGHSAEDAQDLTQDFFLMILRGDLLRRAQAARGRFRSLLLKSLKNFIVDAHDKAHTRKRGGHMEFVSWDDWMADAPSRLRIPAAAANWPPDRIFDLRWAATVAEQALRRLQEECETRGRRRVFDTLSGCLVAGRDEISYEKLARDLGVATEEIKRCLHQLRVRYRHLLRAEVAATVERPEEIDDEVRYLVAALAASGS
jgi:RNA polymerase sigma-70 factor (ECF subfamily)